MIRINGLEDAWRVHRRPTAARRDYPATAPHSRPDHRAGIGRAAADLGPTRQPTAIGTPRQYPHSFANATRPRRCGNCHAAPTQGASLAHPTPRLKNPPAVYRCMDRHRRRSRLILALWGALFRRLAPVRRRRKRDALRTCLEVDPGSSVIPWLQAVSPTHLDPGRHATPRPPYPLRGGARRPSRPRSRRSPGIPTRLRGDNPFPKAGAPNKMSSGANLHRQPAAGDIGCFTRC
jgi:hypothetical protein